METEKSVIDEVSKEAIEKIKRCIRQATQRDLVRMPWCVPERFEEEKMTFERFKIKIQEQNNKCYVCQQEFRYDGGKWCYFFPSLDRINNSMPHITKNCAISCFFCNVRMFKGITEKKCALCDGLAHNYEGEVITKSALFKSLGNNNDRIHEFIDNLKINSVEP